MKKLIEGIIDFRQKYIVDYRNKFAKLALRQSPDALFVACCDSRVVPNTFASSDPGDLFVLRNIGNLIPPYQNNYVEGTSVSAAIEFALSSLQVSDIVICGHSDCGAMQALLGKTSDIEKQPYLKAWLEYAAPSYKRFQDTVYKKDNKITPVNVLSQINVLQQLDHLKSYPLVAERLQSNKLRVHGWWFDLATADVYYYNPAHDKFILIDEQEAEIIFTSL